MPELDCPPANPHPLGAEPPAETERHLERSALDPAEIERLETLLQTLRENPSTARETEAIREIGLEIALAVREVGAMLINVGWEQSYAANRDPQQAG